MTGEWFAGFRLASRIGITRSTATGRRARAFPTPRLLSTGSYKENPDRQSIFRQSGIRFVAGNVSADRSQSKFRRTLLRKCADAFLDLGAAHAVAGAAVGGRFIQPAAGEFVD